MEGQIEITNESAIAFAHAAAQQEWTWYQTLGDEDKAKYDANLA